jgi:hypothetical protein
VVVATPESQASTKELPPSGRAKVSGIPRVGVHPLERRALSERTGAPVAPSEAKPKVPRPPTWLELLGRRPCPILAFGIDENDLAWPIPREPEPLISVGGRLLTKKEVEAGQAVVDPSSEWARLKALEPWSPPCYTTDGFIYSSEPLW